MLAGEVGLYGARVEGAGNTAGREGVCGVGVRSAAESHRTLSASALDSVHIFRRDFRKPGGRGSMEP